MNGKGKLLVERIWFVDCDDYDVCCNLVKESLKYFIHHNFLKVINKPFIAEVSCMSLGRNYAEVRVNEFRGKILVEFYLIELPYVMFEMYIDQLIKDITEMAKKIKNYILKYYQTSLVEINNNEYNRSFT